MTCKGRQVSLLVALLAFLTAFEATAWGPDTQRAITATSIQVIRRTHTNVFKGPEKNNYEDDVLRGASQPYEFLNGGRPFRSMNEALAAVDNEIKLLRDVRNYGMGSYFAYRMGMLSALVADMVMPFAIEGDLENPDIKTQIEADVDKRVAQFGYMPSRNTLEYVRTARAYFTNQRPFYEQNKQLIIDDYRRGKGPQGFMKDGAQAFFSRAVESVADVWHTVLRVQGESSHVAPADEQKAWYFVDEVRYLLHEKENFYQSTVTYKNFEKVNPHIGDAIEKMGDLFYAFKSAESQERAVQEWKLAYDTSGAQRRRIGKKLAEYFIKKGEGYLSQAKEEDDLPNALQAFTTALEFDQTNDLAASRINETNNAILARQERRMMNANIIAAAQKVMAQAEAANVAGDSVNAIATYKQAQSLFSGVDTEFTDQAATASDSVKSINKSITEIINKVLEDASAAIDEGDKERTNRRYDEAIKCYERVPGILNAIVVDETTTHGKDKKDLLDLAQSNITLAQESKRRAEEQAKIQAQNQKGGKPAAK